MRKLAVLAALVVLGWLLFQRMCAPGRDPGGAEHLVGRLWLERLPRDDRDIVRSFAAATKPRLAMFSRSSVWAVRLDLARYQVEKGKITFELPQEKKRVVAGVRTWRCEREAPKPFELCLELETTFGKRRYFSREDWTLEDGEIPEALESRARAVVAPDPAAAVGEGCDGCAAADLAELP